MAPSTNSLTFTLVLLQLQSMKEFTNSSQIFLSARLMSLPTRNTVTSHLILKPPSSTKLHVFITLPFKALHQNQIAANWNHNLKKKYSRSFPSQQNNIWKSKSSYTTKIIGTNPSPCVASLLSSIPISLKILLTCKPLQLETNCKHTDPAPCDSLPQTKPRSNLYRQQNVMTPLFLLPLFLPPLL